MATSLLKSALKLSKSERILLVEKIWDSVAETQDAGDLPEAQSEELDRRLARFKRTGPLGSSWAEVKGRLRKRRA